jgi:hypothetical protein
MMRGAKSSNVKKGGYWALLSNEADMPDTSRDFAIVFDIVLGVLGLVLGGLLFWLLAQLVTSQAQILLATLAASLTVALGLSAWLLRDAYRRWNARQRPPARQQHAR